jgi:uncharacterized protein
MVTIKIPSLLYTLLFLLLLVMGIVAWKVFYVAQQIQQQQSVGNPMPQPSKYAQATVQPVTFYAQYSYGSNKMMARKGIIFRKPHARATIMICHGFMCDKTDVRFLRMLFQEYNVMIFDFRAHGESCVGQQCTFGQDEMFDIIAAARFIKSDSELGKIPLVVYAFSMGAVSSINAQAHAGDLFDCAIWDCPFDSTDALLDRSIDNLKVSLFGYTIPFPGRSFLKKYAYNDHVQSFLKYLLKTVAKMDASEVNTRMVPINTVQAIQKVSIPSLFIVCQNDDKAPPHAVKKIYDGAQGYKRLWITNGRRHFDSFFYNPEKYAHKVRRFIEKYLDGSFAKKEQAKIVQDPLEL